ncbi:YjcZ family sporulation protein [Paenibacillus humicus]|nr:YjcZ family sporulation protein [Paenibacillus humicus]
MSEAGYGNTYSSTGAILVLYVLLVIVVSSFMY